MVQDVWPASAVFWPLVDLPPEMAGTCAGLAHPAVVEYPLPGRPGGDSGCGVQIMLCAGSPDTSDIAGEKIH